MPEYQELDNAKALKKNGRAFMKLRDDVLKALEEARNQKVIGKSLTAKVTLYVNENTKAFRFDSRKCETAVYRFRL